mmetsp:Transcript_10153/g.29585  ORF Transcript_10153/g.29585 Transcript_10153/m.29585 type:complete len:275 (-) Transcript_10153:227-1051(-)
MVRLLLGRKSINRSNCQSAPVQIPIKLVEAATNVSPLGEIAIHDAWSPRLDGCCPRWGPRLPPSDPPKPVSQIWRNNRPSVMFHIVMWSSGIDRARLTPVTILPPSGNTIAWVCKAPSRQRSNSSPDLVSRITATWSESSTTNLSPSGVAVIDVHKRSSPGPAETLREKRRRPGKALQTLMLLPITVTTRNMPGSTAILSMRVPAGDTCSSALSSPPRHNERLLQPGLEITIGGRGVNRKTASATSVDIFGPNNANTSSPDVVLLRIFVGRAHP